MKLMRTNKIRRVCVSLALLGGLGALQATPASADSHCSQSDHTHPHYTFVNWHTDVHYFKTVTQNNGGWYTYQHWNGNGHNEWQQPVSCSH